MTAALSSRRRDRRLLLRARFFACSAMQWYGGVVRWPLDHDAALVAVYAALVHAGVDPQLAQRAVEIAPPADVWPLPTFADGRTHYTREDVRAGLDCCDADDEDDALPDAIDFMLATGAR